MKKTIIFVMALVCLGGFTALSFASAEKNTTAAKETNNAPEIITGTISSIDASKNEIVVKDAKTGVDKTILTDAKTIASLKAGKNVKVTLKSGTNTAVHLKETVSKKTAAVKSKK